ncbi:phosphatidylserine decarboxylase family protein [Paraburkholderia sp. 22099]|jgi:phosphatidylserine decarboxylase|uniref:phosphatidylserine decarboxylase family protein n=1 Tax=Paraburkholderia TaxID=1822464 RepID=UPI0028546D82|nr:phosphatidylserine decarboxylase family protein [Paraburkholderia terricola]MDR6445224.1 phosphatidylserine decarboxylase [Paraburkholderia terricola]
MTSESKKPLEQRRRLGGWLPDKEAELVAFRKELARRARQRAASAPRTHVVDELRALIEGDTVLRMNLSRAIDQAQSAGYELGYSTIGELIDIIDYVTTYAPPFSESSLIHCPLNALLDWPMCMPSGYAVFRDPAFNARLKRVLNVWCGFLSGPHSRMHLNDSPDGWFCEEAQRRLGISQFLCDPHEPHWGFASWNSFFTRQFKPGARPLAEAADSKIIVSACEASPYEVRHGIRFEDSFWLKSQPYSVREILERSPRELAERFVGGSIYQAFLSAFNYHRWHAPVAGTIREAYQVDGTYYSDAESEGEDPGGLNDSQGYTTAVAARAVIVIDCDDPAIGQVACVFVGMAEVSSCMIDVFPGQHVSKGEELGFFQYGGSTYCLIFEPDVIRGFVVQPPFDNAQPIRVNAHLATAR